MKIETTRSPKKIETTRSPKKIETTRSATFGLAELKKMKQHLIRETTTPSQMKPKEIETTRSPTDWMSTIQMMAIFRRFFGLLAVLLVVVVALQIDVVFPLRYLQVAGTSFLFGSLTCRRRSCLDMSGRFEMIRRQRNKVAGYVARSAPTDRGANHQRETRSLVQAEIYPGV